MRSGNLNELRPINVHVEITLHASDGIALDIENILRPFQVGEFILVFHDMHFCQICQI